MTSRDIRAALCGVVLVVAAFAGWSVAAQQPVTVTNTVTDYTEDTPHVTGNTGPALLTRRVDTPSASATPTGDYALLNTDENGGIWTIGVGCTPGGFISAASVNETELKASSGQLMFLALHNIGAVPVYIKLYNDTAANIDETDTPVQRYLVTTNATAANGASIVLPIPVGGINFSTAITLRATTGIADNSTAALSANQVLVNYCVL